MCLFLPTQKLTKAVVETLESRLMANGRGLVFVTGTDSTLSVFLPLSWWGRRTSPARRTTSGRLRNPAAFVSPCFPYIIQILHNTICTSTTLLKRGINMYVCADECREGCIINDQIIPTVCQAEAVDFETIGGLIS